MWTLIMVCVSHMMFVIVSHIIEYFIICIICPLSFLFPLWITSLPLPKSGMRAGRCTDHIEQKIPQWNSRIKVPLSSTLMSATRVCGIIKITVVDKYFIYIYCQEQKRMIKYCCSQESSKCHSSARFCITLSQPQYCSQRFLTKKMWRTRRGI